MFAPRIWEFFEEIGLLPREQLTWVKAAKPEDIATSTAWGSWRSASNPVLRAVAEPVFIASKLTHRRSPGMSDLTSDEFMAWTRNGLEHPSGKPRARSASPVQVPSGASAQTHQALQL